tara:strand:- start:312 stop:887 length:576 start_codon:yes stop_codon:yes gene_type:complete
MAILAFDCEGSRIRLHLSEEGDFSFLFLNHYSETYALGNPGKKMLLESDDRLMRWIAGKMAMSYVENDHQDLLDEVDDEQKIYIAAGFCFHGYTNENEEIQLALEDLEEEVYPQLKGHLQKNHKEFEMRRKLIRQNYTHEELFLKKRNVETEADWNVPLRGIAGYGVPELTSEHKNELEIWALHNPEHVPI